MPLHYLLKLMSARNHRHNLLDLQHLMTFRTVVSTGTFTRAAVKLGYSQSSVSYQIQLLERSLGLSLFKRGRFAKIVLTEAGCCVLEHSGRLLMLAEETRAAILKANTVDII
jgi:DNA-binding transcriptional LysR family regulator